MALQQDEHRDFLEDELYTGLDQSAEVFRKYFDLGTNRNSIKQLRQNCILSAGSGSVRGGVGSSYIFAKNNSIDRTSFFKRTQISLTRVLQCRPVLLMFYKYLHLRHATEALLFWLDVESFQNMTWKPIRILGIDQEQRKSDEGKNETAETKGTPQEELETEARRIFSTYLSTQARKEVCVAQNIVEKVIHNLNHIDENCFRDAQRDVFRDLERGSFQEFLSCLSEDGISVVEKHFKSCAASPGLATFHALNYRNNSVEFKSAA